MQSLFLILRSIGTAFAVITMLAGLTACVTCDPPYCHSTNGYYYIYNAPSMPLSGYPVNIDNHAALEFVGDDGTYIAIERHSFEGHSRYAVPAYPLLFENQIPRCLGKIYFMKKYIGYSSPISSCTQPADKSLLADPNYTSPPDPTISRQQITGAILILGHGNPNNDVHNSYLACVGVNGKGSCATLVWKTAKGEIITNTVQVKPAAEVGSWLETLGENYALADKQFLRMVSVLIPPTEQAQINSANVAGNVYYSKGDYENAFTKYLYAIRVTPLIWTVMPDTAELLRDKIIDSAARMPLPPPIPDDAVRFETLGKVAVENAQNSGDLGKAYGQFANAVNIAPWWADGYYNLAVTSEKMKNYAGAAQNLKYYLRANPNASDAASIKLKIYALQSKAQQQ